MKVLFDYPALSQKHGGVSRYICEIIKQLQDRVEIDLSILYTDNLYLRELDTHRVKYLLTEKEFKGKKKLEHFLNTVYANYKIIRNDFDLFHATFSDAYFLKQTKKPVVVTIHDMINEKLPEYHVSHARHIESKKRLIEHARQIIAISENTKKDILEVYPVNPDKITVIYHGTPELPQRAVPNEYGRYLLFVGRRTRYKNFPFFMESVAPLLREDQDLKVICIGPAFLSHEENFLSGLKVREQVLSMSVPDEVLSSMYRNALVFVFPSLFEGFGIPVLEAFSAGCPVCLSNATCFPEIAGNAALYFDPADKDSLRETVKKVISDPALAAELRRAGAKRLSLFSWKTAALQTLEVYRKAV